MAVSEAMFRVGVVSYEGALESMGVLVWPMAEFEADDALASAAAKAAQELLRFF
jgi:hypothetical protein